MTKEHEIKELIQKIAGTKGSPFIYAKVVDVYDEVCTVEIGDLEITDVQLSPIVDGNEHNLIVKPTVGSNVLLVDLSLGDLRHLIVIGYSEISSIRFGDGSYGGLVKVNDLTEKINSLVDWCKGHKHPDVIVAVTGNATGVLGNTGVATSSPAAFSAESYTNTKIMHGQ